MSIAPCILSVLIARTSDKLHLCSYTDSSFAASGATNSGSSSLKTQQQRILERMNVPPSGGYQSFDHKDAVYYAFVDAPTNVTILAVINKLLWSGSAAGATLQSFSCAVLDAVFSEFIAVHPVEQIAAVSKPFAFIKFDIPLQKVLKRVASASASTSTRKTIGGPALPSDKNEQIDLLKKELHDVHNVIKSNLEDILSRGERLETMSSYSSQLKEHSGAYHKKTVHMNRMRMLKTYGPPAAIVLFILLFLWFRFV